MTFQTNQYPTDVADLIHTGPLFDNADAIVILTGSNLDMGSNDITNSVEK